MIRSRSRSRKPAIGQFSFQCYHLILIEDQMKCARCKSEAMDGASLCVVHAIRARIAAWAQQRPSCKPYMPRSLSKGRAGDDPLAVIAKGLLVMLEHQKYTCAISGKRIALGVNAEIDHIIPIASDPEKAFDLSNLRWVDARINKTNTRGKPRQVGLSDEQKLLKALIIVQHKASTWEIRDEKLSSLWEEIQQLTADYQSSCEPLPLINASL